MVNMVKFWKKKKLPETNSKSNLKMDGFPFPLVPGFVGASFLISRRAGYPLQIYLSAPPASKPCLASLISWAAAGDDFPLTRIEVKEA